MSLERLRETTHPGSAQIQSPPLQWCPSGSPGTASSRIKIPTAGKTPPAGTRTAPPACGNIAASSPYASAAAIVRQPVRIQVKQQPAAEPVCREISAATIKMPEPIIEPTTIIVASYSPIAFTNWCSPLPAAVLVGVALVASAMRLFPSVEAVGFAASSRRINSRPLPPGPLLSKCR